MKNGNMPESQEESVNPFLNMQAELHRKGSILTKAWADLFSYLTRYQADLMVKENAVDIAEKEVDTRKKQIEEMKSLALDSDEFVKLQDDMNGKERLLLKVQSEHSVTETQLKQVQSDLTNHMELLEKSRADLLDKHAELIQYRGDIERLKSELTIREEQLQIKDNLLKKLQSQLMRENMELKEQSEMDRRALLLERRAHEITRSALKDKTKKGSSMKSSLTDFPNSPPSLDLSVEQEDTGLSSIISAVEKQTQRQHQLIEQDCHIMSSSHMDLPISSSQGASDAINYSRSETSILHNPNQKLWGNRSRRAKRFRPNHPNELNASLNQPIFPKQEPVEQSHSSSPDHADQSEVFFPLSVSKDANESMDTSGVVMSESELKPVSGRPASGMSGSPETSESSQIGQGFGASSGTASDGHGMMTVPGALQQDSGGVSKNSLLYMSPEKTEKPWVCTACRKTFRNKQLAEVHIRTHTGEKPYECEYCQRSFAQYGNLQRHVRIHTGETPFKCSFCQKGFKNGSDCKQHEFTHLDKPFSCTECMKGFRTEMALKGHIMKHYMAQGTRQSIQLMKESDNTQAH